MATLVLGAAGAALAGPWGAAIGSMLGQSVDRDLFGQVRQGPRLGDLSVQTSQYGTQISRIFGSMRVAGTVIWATDLQESGTVESGGKGGPDTVNYAYSASFAVALSSRAAMKVGRIWADGKLLRGAAGDFKVRTNFRFYSGTEDQPADPLIASIEGLNCTTAFRGLAVAVFDQLQLASYGNRIPVITFELVADAANVSLADVLSDMGPGGIHAETDFRFDGYAAHGSTRIEAIQPLLYASGLRLIDINGTLMSPGKGKVIKIDDELLGCTAGGQAFEPMQRWRVAEAELPATLSLTHYDAARDYQAGEKHASVAGRGVRHDRNDLPAVISAEGAKSVAENWLARIWRERDRLTLRLPLQFLSLQVGDVLLVGSTSERWEAFRISIEDFVVVVDCRRASSAVASSGAADSGRALREPDEVASRTFLHLLDLPRFEETDEGLTLHLAAAGGDSPWRAVPVEVAAGSVTSTIATAARRSVVGRTEGVLEASGSCLLDLQNSVVVALRHSGDWLASCTDDALAGGENMAMLGSELLQFGTAAPLGQGRFRLSRLLRGRRGTEWAAHHQSAGEAFSLLDPASLTKIALPISMLNAAVEVRAAGIGDDVQPGQAVAIAAGQGLREPSPVALSAFWSTSGDLEVSWLRRSSRGFAWIDGEEPIAAEDGLFKLRLTGETGTLEVSVRGSQHRFAAADARSLGAGPLALLISDQNGAVASQEVSHSITART